MIRLRYVLSAGLALGAHSVIFLLRSPAEAAVGAQPEPLPQAVPIELLPDLPPPEPLVIISCPGPSSPEGPPGLPETPEPANVFITPVNQLRPNPPGVVVTLGAPNYLPRANGSGGPGGTPGGTGIQIFEQEVLDQQPVALLEPSPEQPGVLRAAHPRDGRGQLKASVRWVVNEKGETDRILGVEHDPAATPAERAAIEKELRRAVARYRFTPGVKDGRTVPFRIQRVFAFPVGR